ncbi:hypothetical protein CISG_04208 [Coccidioides immitis RMSCC 3703]|uniref:Uncharacterized protein n=1 Tax=Coccidioides immitis RMSCC 3703 TaxID=454286 RepID=A0A0J8QT86_COCIT|nr:hypothetical protein CISG_04208 [Coccidioides immitis RMSCC 3703]
MAPVRVVWLASAYGIAPSDKISKAPPTVKSEVEAMSNSLSMLSPGLIGTKALMGRSKVWIRRMIPSNLIGLPRKEKLSDLCLESHLGLSVPSLKIPTFSVGPSSKKVLNLSRFNGRSALLVIVALTRVLLRLSSLISRPELSSGPPPSNTTTWQIKEWTSQMQAFRTSDGTIKKKKEGKAGELCGLFALCGQSSPPARRDCQPVLAILESCQILVGGGSWKLGKTTLIGGMRMFRLTTWHEPPGWTPSLSKDPEALPSAHAFELV